MPHSKRHGLGLRVWVWFAMAVAFAVCLGCATTDTAFLDKASKLSSAGEWDRAVQVYQEAMLKHPDSPELKLLLTKAKWNASMSHMRKGQELLRRGHFDDAISEFQMALAFYPGNRKAARLIEKTRNTQESLYQAKKGKVFLKSGKYAQAKEAFERALELNPANLEAKKGIQEVKKKAQKPPLYCIKVKAKGPISLKFKRTPVSNVFEVLSRITGINFIFDKDVQDTRVTLFMTDVSFDQFLDVLLKTSGLAAKVVDPTTMVIYPNVEAKLREYQDLKIRTFYLNYLDVKKAVALLAKIVKTRDIIGNEKLHAITVRGTREQIEIASRLIEANDRPPAETLLNVEVLEVSRRKERQLGIEFNPSSITFGLGEASKEINAETSFASTASVYALDHLTSKEVLLSIPTATLNLLRKDTDTKVLANPQIRAKSGEKARIHIGERVPLRVNRRIDTTGAVTNDYEYQDIGVKLDVQPVINSQNEVTLKLNVEVSALGPNLGTVDEPQYSIRTRKATSVLAVRDGEPVIIGGLISDEERNTVRKVPFLGDIPVLGHLFTNLDTTKIKTDILMTITPIVLRGQRVPGKDVREIWSGQSKEFSTREPYESIAERKMEYLDNFAGKKDARKARVVKENVVPPSRDNTLSSPLKADKDAEGSPNPGPGKDTQVVPRSANNQDNESKSPVKMDQLDKTPPGPSAKATPPEAGARADITSLWPKMLGYSIHVGSYQEESRAERRLNELKKENYDVFMIPAHVPGKGFYYRLFVGKFKDKESAQMVCDTLKAKDEFPRDIHVVKRNWAFGG